MACNLMANLGGSWLDDTSSDLRLAQWWLDWSSVCPEHLTARGLPGSSQLLKENRSAWGSSRALGVADHKQHH
ncbi:hypothetical protein VNO77_27754 [Canavalia gladiata]|uniref:Uncharacterized protein n=1 Tax=Canavalia gladiata TaxID=3824 RepID=A0AAN9KUK6_CANGL